MRRPVLARLLIGCAIVPFAAPAAAAVITGTVLSEGVRPVGGARVAVLDAAGATRCETTSAADGTFSLGCDAIGPHLVRASIGALSSPRLDAVDLGPDRQVHLNLLLVAAAVVAPAHANAGAPPGFWTRPLANPVLTTLNGRPLTLRIAAT